VKIIVQDKSYTTGAINKYEKLYLLQPIIHSPIPSYLSPTELVEPPTLRKAYKARLGLSLLAELVGLFGLFLRPRESPSPSLSCSLKCQSDSALSRIGLAGGEMVCDAYEDNEHKSGGVGARLQAVDLAGASSSYSLSFMESPLSSE
jgi:hypothetical protein